MPECLEVDLHNRFMDFLFEGAGYPFKLKDTGAFQEDGFIMKLHGTHLLQELIGAVKKNGFRNIPEISRMCRNARPDADEPFGPVALEDAGNAAV